MEGGLLTVSAGKTKAKEIHILQPHNGHKKVTQVINKCVLVKAREIITIMIIDGKRGRPLAVCSAAEKRAAFAPQILRTGRR